MLQTYEAILQGNKLKWKGAAPHQVDKHRKIAVHVTLLENITDVSEAADQGPKMAAALASLAALRERSIADPVAWQKESRQDRPLPR